MILLVICGWHSEEGEGLRWDSNTKTVNRTYLSAKNLDPGNSGRVGGAQTSKGALTVQKARMLHDYQLQEPA